MFTKQLSVFTPRHRREYLVSPPSPSKSTSSSSATSTFFTKRYASLPDISSSFLRGAAQTKGPGRVAWNLRTARLMEERVRDGDGDDNGRSWFENREGGDGRGGGDDDEVRRQGEKVRNTVLQRRGEKIQGRREERERLTHGMVQEKRRGRETDSDIPQGRIKEEIRISVNGVMRDGRIGRRGGGREEEREFGSTRIDLDGKSNIANNLFLSPQHVNPLRDRSRVGVRSALPFTTVPPCSSSSGVSSGSSDTQSQGSGGGDSKSDSPTPEGTRKNGEVVSAGVAGVSVRCGKGHELSVPAARASAPSGVRESAALRQEVETLRAEITKARQTILHMQEREKKLKDRLGDRAARGLERGNTRLENVNLGERRPTALVRKYGNLYAQARVDTLDSLDALPDLKNAEELKSKLLFSVVVLAFRSAHSSAQALREEVRRILQVPPPPPTGEAKDNHLLYDTNAFSLEQSVSAFVTANIEKRDLSKNVEEVCQQIWATLYDYPSLKNCEGLLQYVKDCVRLAWGLSNQVPPYVIDYETRTYRKDYHVRFHVADPECDAIKTYLWPALLEGPGGPCVQKGVVIT